MNVLAKIQFGSKLYGTNVEGSDDDYRAIYLPSITDCILGRAKDAWEDKSEEDTSYFSIQHFCRLAVEGQSLAIELLAAPDSAVVANSPIWEILRQNRKRFYTKNMHSFLGFAKTMAGKYSARVDRLLETEAVIAALQGANENIRLGDVWDVLPESLNAQKGVNDRNRNADNRVYRICGRELQATVTVGHALSVITSIRDSYGERVNRAKSGQIEWKSLAHAFRAALQCKEIVETGDLKFPLKDAEWLRSLRLGKFDFIQEGLDQRLDDLIAGVQQKIDASSLPDKADKYWVDNLIVAAYNQSL
jgi:hypothetical protein